MHFFHGPPDAGHKFVLIDVRLQVNLQLAWSIVPRCFQLVDDGGRRYFPLSRSPFFIAHTDQLKGTKGEVYEGQLLFEIPTPSASTTASFLIAIQKPRKTTMATIEEQLTSGRQQLERLRGYL